MPRWRYGHERRRRSPEALASTQRSPFTIEAVTVSYRCPRSQHRANVPADGTQANTQHSPTLSLSSPLASPRKPLQVLHAAPLGARLCSLCSRPGDVRSCSRSGTWVRCCNARIFLARRQRCVSVCGSRRAGAGVRHRGDVRNPSRRRRRSCIFRRHAAASAARRTSLPSPSAARFRALCVGADCSWNPLASRVLRAGARKHGERRRGARGDQARRRSPRRTIPARHSASQPSA